MSDIGEFSIKHCVLIPCKAGMIVYGQGYKVPAGIKGMFKNVGLLEAEKGPLVVISKKWVLLACVNNLSRKKTLKIVKKAIQKHKRSIKAFSTIKVRSELNIPGYGWAINRKGRG